MIINFISGCYNQSDSLLYTSKAVFKHNFMLKNAVFCAILQGKLHLNYTNKYSHCDLFNRNTRETE
jgi:hypothetical protein